ncbi:amidohydrolase [Mycobacterium sp. SMC-8]|uniref:amidohydrolase family protein n=1 Tax=Mycobacterium sp. SMC-8 TaxID=2857060 RepID=UPI0022031929|nr:amidohydrolase [Mycobacterium sp. SMC-8]
MHTHAVDPDLPDLSRRHCRDRWPSVERTDENAAWLNYGAQRYRRIDHRCWAPAARLADMDRDGVALQVISPIPVTFCYDADPTGGAELAAAQNDFFARIVSGHPDRFAALGAVALQDPDLAVDELRRCMTRPGFLGVEIATQVRGCELSDERLDRFFGVAHELGALVMIHPRDEDLPARTTGLGMGFGAGMPVETALAAASLLTSGALVRRPGVRLCLAHGAGALPSIIGRLDKGARIGGMAADSPELPSRLAQSLWCDSLTYNRSALLAAVDLFGADHLVFGSDYPFPAAPEPLDDVVADLPPDLRDRITRKNLEENYGAIPGTGHDALSPVGRH